MIKLENILKSIPNQEIIESHLGQWEYPGRITKIPSNQITMQPDPRTGKEIEHILIKCLNDKWYKQIPQDQPNYILRSFGARSSNAALPLHIDSFIPYKGDEVIAMQVVIVLEDMTIENGCTVVIPGSHQAGEYADNKVYDQAIPLTLKAGDVAIWDSRLWHGTTNNKTEGTRWAIIATFTRWWIKQHFEITDAVPSEIYNHLSPKYRSILGYCSKPWKTEYEGIEIKKGYDYVK